MQSDRQVSEDDILYIVFEGSFATISRFFWPYPHRG